MISYQNFIAGAWGGAAERLTLLDPSDAASQIATLPLSSVSGASSACAAARDALTGWRRTAASQRAAIVAGAAALLTARADVIAPAIGQETGLTTAESRAEIASCAATQLFGAALAGQTTPAARPASLSYTVHRPRGVVGLLAAWSSPLAEPFAQIASALALGNTVVFKPAHLAPAAADAIVRAFVDAGLPDGALNLVYGDASVSRAIAEHGAVRALLLADADDAAARQIAAARGIPCWSAPGGGGTAIVLADADLDLAVTAIARSAFGGSGWRAGSLRRVVLLHPIADAAIEQLLASARRLRLGPALEATTDVGPCPDASYLEHVIATVAAARATGAEILTGGARAGGRLAGGFFIPPTIIDRVRPDMALLHNEPVGPLLAVLRAETFDEALALANGIKGSAAAIYTRDAGRMFQFLEQTEAGHAQVNTSSIEPGWDGQAALAAFLTETQSVTIQH